MDAMPVDIITGFLVDATFLSNGRWLFSNDAILYAGTFKSSKNSTAVSSKGVLNAIRPSSQNTNQQQSIPTYDLETTDQSFEDIQVYESNQNENIFGDEVPTMTNIENSGEIQSFESFNPNVVRVNKQKNINISPRVQKTYRSTVPSDAYDFGRIQPKNRNTSYVKRNNNYKKS